MRYSITKDFSNPLKINKNKKNITSFFKLETEKKMKKQISLLFILLIMFFPQISKSQVNTENISLFMSP